MEAYTPHRRHGDDGPPVRVQHGVELGALLGGVLLDGEGERGEDEHAHRHEEQEQPQLLVAVLYGEPETLEADRVAGKLEDSENEGEAGVIGYFLDDMLKK